MASYGGFIGAVGAAIFVMRRRGMSRPEMWVFLDAVAFSFPFAWTIARAGCAAAKDHPGIHSTSWLAVPYPDGRRFDLHLRIGDLRYMSWTPAQYSSAIAACLGTMIVANLRGHRPAYSA